MNKQEKFGHIEDFYGLEKEIREISKRKDSTFSEVGDYTRDFIKHLYECKNNGIENKILNSLDINIGKFMERHLASLMTDRIARNIFQEEFFKRNDVVFDEIMHEEFCYIYKGKYDSNHPSVYKINAVNFEDLNYWYNFKVIGFSKKHKYKRVMKNEWGMEHAKITASKEDVLMPITHVFLNAKDLMDFYQKDPCIAHQIKDHQD